MAKMSEDKKTNIYYKTVACAKLTDEELAQCKELFDNHYGKWDKDSFGKGKPIRFPRKNYEEYKALTNTYVALAMQDGKVIGQAFYLRDLFQENRYVSWVLQLVVHKEFRQRGIAKTLLYSIWGFSGDFAWGLATSNALTVKTLEKATLRKVNPDEMVKRREMILMIRDKVPFAKGKELKLDNKQAILDSGFPVEREVIEQNLKLYDDRWTLGSLPEGFEWLAFTFRDQKYFLTKRFYDDLFENSEKIVRDAYSRMNLSVQYWNKHQKEEVDFIIDHVGSSVKTVLDFGCGNGRHAIECADRGMKATGVDYSDKNIQAAKQNDVAKSVEFFQADCRKVRLKETYDLALCLYDVVGSFVRREDNLKILRNLNRHLNAEGYLVLSVMNGELTKHMAKHMVPYVSHKPDALVELPPSRTMQVSGNIFNPDYYLLETRTGVVYRKEQFENDGELSAEYVIRDKRYTRMEIGEMLEKTGFKVCEIRCVQAGRWEKALDVTDPRAKEILIIARKESIPAQP